VRNVKNISILWETEWILVAVSEWGGMSSVQHGYGLPIGFVGKGLVGTGMGLYIPIYAHTLLLFTFHFLLQMVSVLH
jgi:hypothetical protein